MSKQAIQLGLFDKATPIETLTITPTKDMPLEVFRQLHRIAFFMECMERLPDGRIMWDEEVIAIYDEGLAVAEYLLLQNDWLSINMELPKSLVDNMQNSETDKNTDQ